MAQKDSGTSRGEVEHYDSDYLTLKHIPFIVELPDLCFQVHVPMCSAVQRDYLPKFKRIDGKGYKCLSFEAYCTKFVLISDSGDALDFFPSGWSNERESYIDNLLPSLDLEPARDYEAWLIYSLFKDHIRATRKQQIIEDLQNNEVSVDGYKKPPIYGCKNQLPSRIIPPNNSNIALL